MIQRMQTVWLFASAVVLLGLFVFPYVSYIDLVGLGKKIMVTGVYSSVNNEPIRESATWLKAVMVALVAICPIFIIFFYKNRKKQIRYALIAMLFIVLLGVWMLCSANALLGEISQKVGFGNIGVGFFLLPIALVFLAMAIRAIRKDEKMLKSADRLR